MTKKRIRHSRGLLWLAFGEHLEQPAKKVTPLRWQVGGVRISNATLIQWTHLSYVTHGDNTLRLTDKGWSVLKRARILR